MSDPKDLDYVALAKRKINYCCNHCLRDSPTQLCDSCAKWIVINIRDTKKAKTEILDWMLEQSMTGMTIPMIRVQIHNKRVEISGEGEKA